MTWMKHFTYLAFLYTFFEYRGASGTKGTCVCTYGDEVYNLAPLQSTDEYKPRFTTPGVGVIMSGYEFGYNPCSSFIKAGGQNSCLNDVAICLWGDNGGSSANNGIQSTAKCGIDPVTGKPQLIYRAANSEQNSTVTLICNRTEKTVKEATFVQDPNSSWNFFLSHICACAGGCPLDPVTTKPLPGTTTPTPGTTTPTPGTTTPTPGTTKPTPGTIKLTFVAIHTPVSTKTTTASYSPWKDIWEPVTIAAGSMVLVFIVISIVVIRLLLKNQNTSNEAGERRRLIGEEERGIDESRNIFYKLNDAGNTANLQYASLIKSASSSSCSDITVPNKDVSTKPE